MQKYLRMSAVIMMLICLAGLLFPFFKPSDANEVFDQPIAYSLGRVDRWEAVAGDLPFDAEGKPIPTSADWQNLAELIEADVDPGEGYYWLRRTIPPELGISQPRIRFGNLKAYEVYIGGEKKISSYMPPSPPIVNHLYSWSELTLSDEDRSETIYLRVYGYGTDTPFSFGTIEFGTGDGLYRSVTRSGLPALGFGFLFLVIGLVSLVLYVRNPRNLLHGAFTLFSLSAALGTLNRTLLIRHYIGMDWLAYVPDVTLPFGFYALMLFMEQVSVKGYRQVFRALGLVSLLTTLICVVTAQTHIVFYQFLAAKVMPTFLIVVGTIAGVALYGLHRAVRSSESRWLFIGFVGVYIGIAYHLVFYTFWLYSEWIFQHAVWLYDVADNATFIGLLWLFFAKAIVLYHRYTELNRRVRKYAEDTATKLQESLRDTAAAIAELSVMEERNRMARDIHDIVGHTLTTTIVQIEAARMLLDKRPGEAMVKLTTTSNLVRGSLDSLRQSMHKLSHSDQEWDLREALSKLISETEAVTGVAIEYDIEDLPFLRIAHKKVLFHALQEGLTNGIRHARATSFQFVLRSDGKSIYFALENNGIPFKGQEFGFGLTGMRERVEGIGGELHVSDTRDEGCRLTIRLPQPAPYPEVSIT